MTTELEKGELLHTGPGYLIFATNDRAVAMMEWADECACRLSFQFHAVLGRHALRTNVLRKQGAHRLIVQRLQPLAVGLLARAGANTADLQFLGSEGRSLTKEQAAEIHGVTSQRVETIEDTGLHAVRSLRAYLLAEGVEELTLRLSFGVAPSGECEMQAINPAECQLGSGDYNLLCERLGGDLK
ncbi:MAG: hypothetical protein JWN15_1842 [Firmicutes bacterium]|nr:hypothetical protein [Bacillota bacterium]